jgi:hypothetical protein
MFGKRGSIPQGASTKAADQAAPYLFAFQSQSLRFIARAKAHQERQEYTEASYWARQAARCQENVTRVQIATTGLP